MLGILFPIALAIICGLVLIQLVRNKPAQPFIIAYWIVLLMKNVSDLFMGLQLSRLEPRSHKPLVLGSNPRGPTRKE